MTQFTFGVDISKTHLDVCRLPDGVHRRFVYDKTGLKALIKWLAAEPVERIVYEPTGRYHRSFERRMTEAGFPPFEGQSPPRHVASQSRSGAWLKPIG